MGLVRMLIVVRTESPQPVPGNLYVTYSGPSVLLDSFPHPAPIPKRPHSTSWTVHDTERHSSADYASSRERTRGDGSCNTLEERYTYSWSLHYLSAEYLQLCDMYEFYARGWVHVVGAVSTISGMRRLDQPSVTDYASETIGQAIV